MISLSVELLDSNRLHVLNPRFPESVTLRLCYQNMLPEEDSKSPFLTPTSGSLDPWTSTTVTFDLNILMVGPSGLRSLDGDYSVERICSLLPTEYSDD